MTLSANDMDIVATCCAVLLLEGEGGLDRAPEREAWARAVLESQDPETGRFGETWLALQALDALGVRPACRLAFLDALTTPGAAAAWVGALDWSDAPGAADRVAALLLALTYRAEVEGDAAAADAYHEALDALDLAQDPETGFWGGGVGVTSAFFR